MSTSIFYSQGCDDFLLMGGGGGRGEKSFHLFLLAKFLSIFLIS